MSRVRSGVAHRKRVKKVLKHAKGYRGRKSKCYRIAKESVMRAWAYAYRDRRNKKRAFRRLWITRINAAVRSHQLSYSKFIYGLYRLNIQLNRLALANMTLEDPSLFEQLVKEVKSLD